MILLKEKQLIEVLGCTKRTAYNKLNDYYTFNLFDIMKIIQYYGIDCNTAIATIIYSSNEYHNRRKAKKEKENERIKTNSK